MAFLGNTPLLSTMRTLAEGVATTNQTVINVPGGLISGMTDVIVGGADLGTADYDDSDGLTIKLKSAMAQGTMYKVVAWTPNQNVFGGTMNANLKVDTKTTDGSVTVTSAAATSRMVTFQTAGSNRWIIGANNTAETGSNVGSDWFINRYSDAGAFIDAPFNIKRSTGLTTVTGITATGFAADGYAQFRAISGNYGAMIRNDGTSVYLLSTASGSQTGTWNSYRPFSWNLSNGSVQIASDGSVITMGNRPTWQVNGTGSFYTPWDTGNFSPSNYLVRNGTSDVSAGGTYFTSSIQPNIANISSSGNDDKCLTISNGSNNSASAVIQFHRVGLYAAYFGLDTDNNWKVGGRSAGAAAYKIVHEGVGSANLSGYLSISGSQTLSYSGYGYLNTSGAGTQAGNSGNVGVSLNCAGRITCPEFDATSDVRLKTEIEKLDPQLAIDFVKNVDSFGYKWRDHADGPIRFGFMAQDVAKKGFENLIKLSEMEGLEETIDDDGWVSPKNIRLAIEYDQVIPIHSSVLKQLLERVEYLESQLISK